MVAKVLCTNAKKSNMSKPTKKEIQNIAAFYNASTVKKGAVYGKKNKTNYNYDIGFYLGLCQFLLAGI